MNLQNLFISPEKNEYLPWQLGSVISEEIRENGVVFIFCSEERGGGGNARQRDFSRVRNVFYELSALDFQMSICDLGDLLSGKNQEDTHYILQEILTECYQKNAIPVVVGGSNDLAFPLYLSLYHRQKSLNYTQINAFVNVEKETEKITEKNFLTHILSDSRSGIKDYHHLGYQRHLNELAAVDLVKDFDFEILRLAEMMGDTDNAEPFLRRADLVTLNCDSVETFAEDFSKNPQVNGLNKREICAYMKEIGLGQNLKCVGMFNFNFDAENAMNHQLLAQMLWYLLEGIHIQKTHPKERAYENYVVLLDEMQLNFSRDTFSGQWYFGKDENIQNCVPCSQKDYEMAKRGKVSGSLLRRKNKAQ